MANNFLQRALKPSESDEPPPLGGTRAQAVQRLQVGVLGIVAMVLVVGLVDVIRSEADEVEAQSVPEAASTVEPSASPTQQADPLSQAGVVPDLPATPSPTASASQEPAIVPEGVATGEAE